MGGMVSPGIIQCILTICGVKCVQLSESTDYDLV